MSSISWGNFTHRALFSLKEAALLERKLFRLCINTGMHAVSRFLGQSNAGSIPGTLPFST